MEYNITTKGMETMEKLGIADYHSGKEVILLEGYLFIGICLILVTIFLINKKVDLS